MTVLAGHPNNAATYVPTGVGGGIPVGGPVNGPLTSEPNAIVIDGTPVRVVVLAFAAAAGLVALRLAGFRFNVGVSG
jgi:hypothetical protein